MFVREQRRSPAPPARRRGSEAASSGTGDVARTQTSQVCPCGGGCPRCAPLQRNVSSASDSGPAFQAKALDGATETDIYEQEADHIANRIAAAPTERTAEPPRIRPYTPSTTDTHDLPHSVTSVLSQPGRPMEPALRNEMEGSFGRDFSSVRIHADTRAEQSARDVQAQAYTVGTSIVFGANRYTPATRDGRSLLAHELTHVVQQTHSVNGLQRKPEKPFVWDVSWLPGVTLVDDPANHRYTYAFRGKPWVTLTYRNRADFQTDIERFGQGSDQILLRVTSSAHVEVKLDLDVEQEIRDARKSIDSSAIGYDFAVHGNIATHERGLTTSVHGPVRRVATDVTQHTVTIEGIPKPDVRESKENWLAGNIKDTYPSFKNLTDLRTYLAANRRRSFAIIRARDGHFIARPVTGADISQLANHTRAGNFDLKKLENIDWYQNAYQMGEYQGLWVEGKEYTDLASLQDSFFDDPASAARNGAGEEVECEVFEMGSVTTDLGISYGRKLLTHTEAAQRWTDLDHMKADELSRLQTEPGHRFIAVHVRGVATMHTIDAGYLDDRDVFRKRLHEFNALGGARGVPNQAGSQNYFESQLDREQDDPDFIALLRNHPDGAYTYGTAHYENIVDAGQHWAADSFGKSADDMREFVADENKLAKWVLRCPQLPETDVRRTLDVLGLTTDDDRWYNAVRLPQNSILLASGGTANGVTMQGIRDAAEKVARGMDDARNSILSGELVAIKQEGPFGDSVRAGVYKQYGYTLDPRAFPYKDKVTSSHWNDREVMGGDRSSFSSLGEQIYATEARRDAAQDNIDKWAKRIGLALASIVLVVALNAAGAAIAGALFAEGTFGYLAMSALVVGTGLTASSALQAHIAGVDMSITDLLKEEAWNVVTAGVLGKLGNAFKEAGALKRFSAIGSAAFGLGFAHFLAEHKGPITSDDLAEFVIENAVMFAAMEAVSALARPLNVRAGIWGRAIRLGTKVEEIGAFNTRVNNLVKDVASLSVRPAEAAREQGRIERTTNELLTEQQRLVKELSAKFSTQGDADQVQAEAGEELQRIKAALEGMRRAKFLSDLKLKRVGDAQTVYSFQNSPDAIQQIKDFFPGSRVEPQSDGTLELYLPGEKEPLTLKPAGSQAAAAPVAAPDSRININSASAKDLQTLEGIGPARAKAIVAAREALPGKRFATVDDLKAVKGMGDGTFAKIAGRIVAGEPENQDARKTDLAERQQALLDRANRKGYTDSSIEAIRRLRPLDTSNPKVLDATEAKIKAAEKQAGSALDQAAKSALDRTSKRLGADAAQLRTGALSSFSDAEIGDALSRIPKGTPKLGVEQLRGLIWAHFKGVPVERLMDMSNVVGAKARNQALDTFGRLADAGVRGADQELRDMLASTDAWRGGAFVLDVARYDIGIENIAAIEEPVSGPGRKREIDIVLKNGTHVELKNWSYDAWLKYRTGLADGTNRTDPGQFLTDVGNARFDPAALQRLRYIFRSPAPVTIAELRVYFRAQLEIYMKGQTTPGQAKAMLDAFDKADTLIVASTARTEGGTMADPVVPDALPQPVQPQREKDKTPAPAGTP